MSDSFLEDMADAIEKERRLIIGKIGQEVEPGFQALVLYELRMIRELLEQLVAKE